MQQEELFQYIANSVAMANPQPGTRIVLGYSGGVDSEVLAYGLSLYAQRHPEYQYLLVHIHHGLNQQADNWAEHCLLRGELYQLDCKIVHVQLNLQSRVSLEAEARDCRYQALAAHMRVGDILLTAHHEDDQLETVLLALTRGLGPKGLAAMGQIQIFQQDKYLVRPLLTQSRAEIEACAARYQLLHIEDDSNFDNRFDRNFLRNEIIPRLKSRWGAIAATASRTASLCGEQQLVLDGEVDKLMPFMTLEAPFTEQLVLQLAALAEHSQPMQSLIVRAFLQSQALAIPSQVQLQQILKQLLYAREDAKLEIRVSGLCIRRFRDCGYFDLDEPAAKQEPLDISSIFVSMHQGSETNGTETIKTQSKYCLIDLGVAPTIVERLGKGGGADLPLVQLPAALQRVSIQFDLPGSTRCRPSHRDKGRTLKKLFQEYAIPPWLRGQIPFVFYDEELVMAVGLWSEKRFVTKTGEWGLSISGSQIAFVRQE